MSTLTCRREPCTSLRAGRQPWCWPHQRPVGVWMVAGSAVADTYPCRCHGDRACGLRCPCRGRTDVDKVPALCCARREHETKERHETGETL